MPEKKWNVLAQDEDRVSAIKAAGCPSLLARLLVNRGATCPEDAREYLRGASAGADPMLLPDMDKAAAVISAAAAAHRRVTVYGDYDADGVTAAALLADCLETLGAETSCYIPDRLTEGYGLSEKSVRAICEAGAELIVTVDTGITAIKEAALIRSLGVRLVITDHHEPGQELPEADAVVDPKRSDCVSPFKEYAGVGVAYKLCCALIGEDKTARRYCQLAALGTVADIVPLVGENRAIVKLGLKYLRARPLPGIDALLAAAGTGAKTADSTTLAFIAAPRLNAAGRMGTAYDALKLMRAADSAVAAPLAQSLDALNSKRRAVEDEIVAGALAALEDKKDPGGIIIVSGEGWHPGVIGIAASRVAGVYLRPTVIVSFENGLGRASCRSFPGFDIHKALTACADKLEHFGGHELAAGFTVKEENFADVCLKLRAYAAAHPCPVPELTLECELSPDDLSPEAARQCAALEPFGSENPQPLFCLRSACVISAAPLKGGKHLKLSLDYCGKNAEAVFFGADRAGVSAAPGDVIDLACSLSLNSYGGRERLELIARGLRPAQALESGRKIYLRELCGGAGEAPDRDDFIKIYRALRAHPSGSARYGELLGAVGGDRGARSFANVLVILDVFSETGLMEWSREGDGIVFTLNKDVKIDLGASQLLKRLSGA